METNYITSATKEHDKQIEEINYKLWQIVQDIRNKRQKVDGFERFDDIVAEMLASASDLLANAQVLIGKMPF